MTHEEAGPLLAVYAAGQLDMAAAAAVQAHLLTGCTACLDVALDHRPLPRPAPPVVAVSIPLPAPVAPPRRARSWIALAAAVGVAAGSAYQLAKSRDAHRRELARATARVAMLESRDADLNARLDRALRDLATARSTPARVTAPPPVAATPVAPAPVPDPDVAYVDDRLSLHVVDAPAAEVVREIGRQAGANVRGAVAGGRLVTARFADVSVSEGLQRVLGTQNFLLWYDDRRRLRTIELLGGGAGAEVVSPAPADAVLPPPPALDLVLDSHMIAVDGVLADALGIRSASLRAVLETGLRHGDDAVRTQAVSAVLRAYEGDGQVRAAADTALAGLDGGALGALVRQNAGDHAESVVRQLVVEARAPELRLRAARLLQQVRGDRHARRGE